METNILLAIALWLCPKQSSQIYETLNSLIIGINPLFEDAPRFEPHITITSQLSINSMSDVNTVLNSCVAALAGGPEMDIELTFNSLKINHKNSYFKKIYLSLLKTKNLASLATIIRELYVEFPNLQNQAEAKYAAQDWCNDIFDPHLSLVYTNLTHFDNALIRTIKTRVEDLLNTDTLSLEDDELLEYNVGWTNGALKIVRCEGPVEEWQVLGKVDIH